MDVFTVDVWVSHDVRNALTGSIIRDAAWAAGHDFHRITVAATDGTAAELLACQMAGSHPGLSPVRSVVIDWP